MATTSAVAALLAIAVLACGRASVDGAERSSVTASDTIFADEFSGREIDRGKWLVYTGEVYNDELQAYVDDTATMHIAHGAEAEGAADGALVIRAHERSGSPRFISGRLHGREAFQYGTVSARMKLPAGAGFWPAFWLLGVGAWPSHGEIDIMENVGDSSWVSVALHGPGYSGDTPLVHRHALPPALDATGWHVYTTAWTRDSIVFFVDDAPIYRVMRADVEGHGSAAPLDSAKYVVLNLALGGIYPAAVNGVRAPLLGLPESTLPRIRSGGAKVLVDWVRWTR